jgi:hypothetical protein
MWNALSIRSLTLPAPTSGWDATHAPGALDLVAWFAVCAALGVTLSWLRALARRAGDAPAPGPRVVRLAPRSDALARA